MTAPVIYLVIPLVLLAACAWLVALLSADQRQARAAARRAERAARPGTPREDQLALVIRSVHDTLDTFEQRGINNFDVPTVSEVLTAVRAALEEPAPEQERRAA